MKKVIFYLCAIALAGLIGYYIRQDHKAQTQAQAQAEPPRYLAGPWIGPNKEYDNSSLIMKIDPRIENLARGLGAAEVTVLTEEWPVDKNKTKVCAPLIMTMECYDIENPRLPGNLAGHNVDGRENDLVYYPMWVIGWELIGQRLGHGQVKLYCTRTGAETIVCR